jgi:hypothetical protein
LVLILLIIGFLSFSWFFFLSILSLNILFNFFFRFSSHLLNYSLFFYHFLNLFLSFNILFYLFFIKFFLSFYFSIKSLIIFFHSVLIILITTCVSF